MEIPNESKILGVQFINFLIRTYNYSDKIFYNLILSFLSEKVNDNHLKEFLKQEEKHFAQVFFRQLINNK